MSSKRKSKKDGEPSGVVDKKSKNDTKGPENDKPEPTSDDINAFDEMVDALIGKKRVKYYGCTVLTGKMWGKEFFEFCARDGITPQKVRGFIETKEGHECKNRLMAFFINKHAGSHYGSFELMAICDELLSDSHFWTVQSKQIEWLEKTVRPMIPLVNKRHDLIVDRLIGFIKVVKMTQLRLFNPGSGGFMMHSFRDQFESHFMSDLARAVAEYKKIPNLE